MAIDVRKGAPGHWDVERGDDGYHTAADHAIWRFLFEQQTRALAGRVCPEYVEATGALLLSPEGIPTLSALNERLASLGEWRVEPAEGLVSHEEYFAMVSKRRFPAASRIRSRDEIVHSKQPDVFHDVFGHVPLLTHPAYDAFVVGMAALALEHAEDEDTVYRLSRAMKWTVEYGLVRDPTGGVRVVGAGLISSLLELEHVLGPEPEHRPFTAAGALETLHTPASLQPSYFVLDSLAALGPALADIRDAVSAGSPPLQRAGAATA